MIDHKERLNEALVLLDMFYDYSDRLQRFFGRLADEAEVFGEKAKSLREEYERVLSRWEDEED
jgi:hypothetical protein